jgi:Disulphide bond corrector protein DsbC
MRILHGSRRPGCPHPGGRASLARLRAQRSWTGQGTRPCIFIALPFLFLLTAFGQDSPGSRRPSVTLLPNEVVSVARGHSGTVELIFRIPPGLHINSNVPRQEYLKKTELKLDAPTDIVVRKITYPDGEDRSFPFAPQEKINVYSGDFTVTVVVRPLKTVLPTKYAVHGRLKYQACDNAACYPPREAPVTFEVRVTKASSETRHKNTPQSPHAHT